MCVQLQIHLLAQEKLLLTLSEICISPVVRKVCSECVHDLQIIRRSSERRIRMQLKSRRPCAWSTYSIHRMRAQTQPCTSSWRPLMSPTMLSPSSMSRSFSKLRRCKFWPSIVRLLACPHARLPQMSHQRLSCCDSSHLRCVCSHKMADANLRRTLKCQAAAAAVMSCGSGLKPMLVGQQHEMSV